MPVLATWNALNGRSKGYPAAIKKNQMYTCYHTLPRKAKHAKTHISLFMVRKSNQPEEPHYWPPKQTRSYKLALTQPCCFRIIQPSFQMLELHCALLTVLHHPISCCRPLSAAGVIKTGSVCNLRCPWTRFFNQLGWIVFMFPWDFGRSMRLDSWTEGLQTGSKKLHLSPFSPQVFTQRSKNQNLRFLATGW